MLFPGTIYIVIFIFGLITVAICGGLAFMVGAIAHRTAEFLVELTNDWKTCSSGAKNAKRWWFDIAGWAGAAMSISFIIFVYTAAGPYWAFIKYLKGI